MAGGRDTVLPLVTGGEVFLVGERRSVSLTGVEDAVAALEPVLATITFFFFSSSYSKTYEQKHSSTPCSVFKKCVCACVRACLCACVRACVPSRRQRRVY